MGGKTLVAHEKKQIAIMKAQGLTDHAISKAIGRSNKTVTAALRDPVLVADIADYQERIACKYEELAERILDAVSVEDISKASLQLKVTAGGICTDKARLIKGQSTINLAAVFSKAMEGDYEEGEDDNKEYY